MKILFVIRSATTFHYFSSTVRALCQKGHRVQVLFDRMKRSREASREPMENIRKDFKNFSYDFAERRSDFWLRPLTFSRELLSANRHLKVSDQADLWRMDQIKYLPARFQRYFMQRNSLANRIIGTTSVAKMLRLVEYITPPDRGAVSFLKEYRPDVILASPTNFGHSSADLEYLKAAKALGIPTAIPVLSWDNLTVRGAFHIMPDRLLVWNKVHAKEAEELHRIPRERIRITGAPFFDGWFTELSPSVSREEFARLAGVSAKDPYIVWLGSPKNIAQDETWLINKVKDEFERSADERLRKMQFVVRPHPLGFKQYETFKRDGIVIFPRIGERTSTTMGRKRFYDTLHYAVAALHINTSAIIDAIIAGKPAITLIDEAYRQSQEKTKHFRDLVKYDATVCVRSPEECVSEIKDLLDGKDARKNARHDFVSDIIRPAGLDTPAGEVAAREVEKLVTSYADKRS